MRLFLVCFLFSFAHSSFARQQVVATITADRRFGILINEFIELKLGLDRNNRIRKIIFETFPLETHGSRIDREIQNAAEWERKRNIESLLAQRRRNPSESDRINEEIQQLLDESDTDQLANLADVHRCGSYCEFTYNYLRDQRRQDRGLDARFRPVISHGRYTVVWLNGGQLDANTGGSLQMQILQNGFLNNRQREDYTLRQNDGVWRLSNQDGTQVLNMHFVANLGLVRRRPIGVDRIRINTQNPQ